jgi:hypothetical protein
MSAPSGDPGGSASHGDTSEEQGPANPTGSLWYNELDPFEQQDDDDGSDDQYEPSESNEDDHFLDAHEELDEGDEHDEFLDQTDWLATGGDDEDEDEDEEGDDEHGDMDEDEDEDEDLDEEIDVADGTELLLSLLDGQYHSLVPPISAGSAGIYR